MKSLEQHLGNAGFGCALVYLASVSCVAGVDSSAPDAKTAVVRQAALSCTGKPAAVAGTKDIYVAPGGSAVPTGSCSKPFATLEAAYNSIGDPTTSDYRVWVRGGVYGGESFEWTKLDLNDDATLHKMAIESYPGEVATFDGLLGHGKFVNFGPVEPTPEDDIDDRDLAPVDADNPAVNLSIRRIHVTNYKKWAIGIYHLGSVTVENSWFTNIGNRWAGLDPGLAVLHMGDADNCSIRNNVFSHVENIRESDIDGRVAEAEAADPENPVDPDDIPKPSDITLIHVAYIHNDSDRNKFESNYVEHCSGDSFKTRNESDENEFLGNVTLWSGNRAFYNADWDQSDSADDDDDQPDEDPSYLNVLAGNVALFPHPEYQDNDLSWCTNEDCQDVRNASGASTPYVDSTGSLYPFIPDYEDVTAATQADVDNDGVDELFVVFRYPGHAGFIAPEREGSVVFPAISGLSLVLRTEGRDDRVLRKVAYRSDYWTEIPAIAGGDFVSGGAKEIIAAFQTPSETRIYRGNGLTSLTNQAMLYKNTDSPPTRVTELAGGNFKTGTGNAGDEFAVAIKNADDTETLWRGNTTTAKAAELWTNTASPWIGYNVGALAAVNPDSTAVQEVAASLHSSAATYLLWDVTAGVASQLYSDTSGSLWRVRSLVSTPASGFDELYAGMEYWNVARTYYFSDLLTGGVMEQIHSSLTGESDRYWDTPAMARRSLAGCAEVISVLSGGNGDTTRVFAGDKESISTFGTYYRTLLTPSTLAAIDDTALPRRTREDTLAVCP